MVFHPLEINLIQSNSLLQGGTDNEGVKQFKENRWEGGGVVDQYLTQINRYMLLLINGNSH